MVNSERFRIETEPPGSVALKIAEQELNETPENVKKGIEQLRQLLRDNDTIYFRDDDEILMIFLRPTKFYAESAFALMKRVADFKESNSKVLQELSPISDKKTLLNNRVVNVLVDRDQLGRRILVANVGELWNTKSVSGDQLFRVFYLIHLAAILEPETQIRGVVVILDFKGLGLSQVMAMSPSFSQRLLTFIQKAMPLRLKEVHIVKQPGIFTTVWTLFNRIVEEKLRHRLHIHGKDMKSLHKHLDPNYLPQDYEGNKPAIDYSSADWYPVLCTIDNHIAEWQKFGKVRA